MRNISFMLTTEQIRNRTKTVTRRLGWENLKVGERLQACVKCQGLKRGEKIQKLAVIEVVSVYREPLNSLTKHPNYGEDEVRLEGFGEPPFGHTPEMFVHIFCRTHKGCTPDTIVTRIEFKYVSNQTA